MTKEFAQMEDLKVYHLVKASSLSPSQRKIKEKRNGNLKGRTCADGRAQRSLYKKAQTTSPTFSNNALVISIIEDAYEGRDVGVGDIAGAYLKADMDDFVVMTFTGEAVRILCEMNPTHKENVM
ncbi:Reverse transcriptase (RNA-dependent DNA polymerase) [Fragilaria crotonensis]|nr:Reverse transcriptase (RNA-dependent DNA polymerase) [Fragilaria crotonensis]